MNQPFVAATELLRAGKPDKAVALLLPLLRKAPKHAPLRYLLGVAHGQAGEYDAAIYQLREAQRIDPGNVAIALDLARALVSAKHHDEGVAAYEHLLRLSPRHEMAYIELSNLHLVRDNLIGATDALVRAVQAHPDLTDAWKALSSIDLLTGRADRSAQRLRRAMVHLPDRPELDTYLCASLNYMPGVSARETFEAHATFGRKTMAYIRTPAAPHPNSRDPGRPLVIGWLSPDLRRHSVAYFLEPLLEGLDKTAFAHVLFSTGLKRDDVTERLAAHGRLIPCRDVEFKALPELIRSHTIDILIELSGHTADHRLWSLARKPAPIIVSYLGYPNTTGLPTIDYRIVDPHTDPPAGSASIGLPQDWIGADSLATERLLRLDAPFLCYRPPENSPPVARCPRESKGGAITFGSFNAIQKMNAELAAIWGVAMNSVPGSRLILKGDYRLSAVRENIHEWFAAAGISRDRVELRTMTPTPLEHLAHYADVDIALDTHPYAGTTTTCEAMYMGVPVLSLVGATHTSRVGYSLLSAVGLSENAVDSPRRLAERSAELASDPALLATLRSTLRARVLESPLCDARAYAARFGRALRTIWEEYCARPSHAEPSQARADRAGVEHA